MTVKTLTLPAEASATNKFNVRKLLRTMWRQRWLYFLMAPTLIYFVIFKYGPLWNAQIAFKDFKPLLGVWGSPWAGFKHFEMFINSFYFTELMTNTLIFSVAKLVLGLPLAVIVAIALHETMRHGSCASVRLCRPWSTCRIFSPGSSCMACCWSFSRPGADC
jgi:putative aldouronate transport system permease protein